MESFKGEFCTRTGLDLECYKDGQMERRIRQFMGRCGSAGFSEFLKLLQRDHEVMKQFQGYLTINTSSLFRDGAVFSFIETEIIADLFGRRRRIKAWSAPCSTGEEPYSLAIILDRHEGSHVVISVQDDGRGIDPDLVRQKAVERGILSEREAKNRSNREMLDFILEPSFSTAVEVTDVSGRGPAWTR